MLFLMLESYIVQMTALIINSFERIRQFFITLSNRSGWIAVIPSHRVAFRASRVLYYVKSLNV